MTAFSIMLFLKSPGARRDGNIHVGLELVRSPGHSVLLNLWFTLSQISQYKEVTKIGHRKLIVYGHNFHWLMSPLWP